MTSKPILFAAGANTKLAEAIANRLKISLGNIYHHQFPSGEWYCQLKENVRGADVFIIQSIASPANDNLMQLLVISDACRRASAGRITAVIPYLGYSRQDRKDKSRVPISAKMVLDIIAAAGINRIVTMDLHAQQIAGFTNLPFDHLYFRPALVEALSKNPIDVVVAPDIGAVKKAEEFARKTKVDLAFISKIRKNDTTVEATQFVGNIKDKSVLILDDLTESAGTLIEAANTCKNNGASKIYCAITHGCFTLTGKERLLTAFKNKLIDCLFVSNTVESKHADWKEYNTDPSGYAVGAVMADYSDKVMVVDVSHLFAEAINGILYNHSISMLFD